METTWAYFTYLRDKMEALFSGYETPTGLVLSKNNCFSVLPIWFRDPVNPKQREIMKICQVMKKITLWSNHLR